jgi:hypothetical protein
MRFAPLVLVVLFTRLTEAQIVVKHQSNTSSIQPNQTKPYLALENQSGSAFDASGASIRYCLYEEIVPADLTTDCWYANPVACSDLTFTVESTSPQTSGDKKSNLCVAIGFRNGTIPAHSEQVIQWGMHEKTWSHLFDERDDLSFTETNGAWNSAPNVSFTRTQQTPPTSETLEERIARLEALAEKLSRAISISESGKVTISSEDSLVIQSAKALVTDNGEIAMSSSGNLSIDSKRDIDISAAMGIKSTAGISHKISATLTTIEATAIITEKSATTINQSGTIILDGRDGEVILGGRPASSFYSSGR